MSAARQALEAEQEQRRRRLVVRSVLDKPSTTREASQQQRQEQEQNIDCAQSDQSTQQPQQCQNPFAWRLCAGKRKELAMLRRKYPTAFYLGVGAGDWEVPQGNHSLAAFQPSPARRGCHPLPWNVRVPERCEGGARSANGARAQGGELPAGSTACSLAPNPDEESFADGSKSAIDRRIPFGPGSTSKSSAPQAESRQAFEITKSQAESARWQCVASTPTPATITSADRGPAHTLGIHGMRDLHTHQPPPPPLPPAPSQLQQDRLKPKQRMLMVLAREMQKLDRLMLAHGAGSGHIATDDPVWIPMRAGLISKMANAAHTCRVQHPSEGRFTFLMEEFRHQAHFVEDQLREIARQHQEYLWHVSATTRALMQVWTQACEGKRTAPNLLRVLRIEKLMDDISMYGRAADISHNSTTDDVKWLLGNMPPQFRKRWQYVMRACEVGTPGADLVATQALCGYIRFMPLDMPTPSNMSLEPLILAAVNACILVAQESDMQLISPRELYHVLDCWPLPPYPFPDPSQDLTAGTGVPPAHLSYNYLMHAVTQLAERPAAAVCWANLMHFAWINRAAWGHLPPMLQSELGDLQHAFVAAELFSAHVAPPENEDPPCSTYPTAAKGAEGPRGQPQPQHGPRPLPPQGAGVKGGGSQGTVSAGQRQGQGQGPTPTAAGNACGRGNGAPSQADPDRGCVPRSDVRGSKQILWMQESTRVMHVLAELHNGMCGNPQAHVHTSTASASFLSMFILLIMPSTARTGTYTRLAFQADMAAELGPTGLRLTVFETPPIPSNNAPGYDWKKIKQALHLVKPGSNVDIVGKALRDALMKKNLRFVWLQAQGMEGVMGAMQMLARVRQEMLARDREFIIRPICIFRMGDSVPVDDGAVDTPSGTVEAGSRTYPAAPADSGGPKQIGSGPDSVASSPVTQTFSLQDALQDLDEQLAAFFTDLEAEKKTEVYVSVLDALQALRWLIEQQSGRGEEFVLEFVVHECGFGEWWTLEPPEGVNMLGTPAALQQQQQREARLQKEKLRKALGV